MTVIFFELQFIKWHNHLKLGLAECILCQGQCAINHILLSQLASTFVCTSATTRQINWVGLCNMLARRLNNAFLSLIETDIKIKWRRVDGVGHSGPFSLRFVTYVVVIHGHSVVYDNLCFFSVVNITNSKVITSVSCSQVAVVSDEDSLSRSCVGQPTQRKRCIMF